MLVKNDLIDFKSATSFKVKENYYAISLVYLRTYSYKYNTTCFDNQIAASMAPSAKILLKALQ